MKDVREALLHGLNSQGQMVRRPLSPHLQVYRPQMTSVTSILHRFTGIGVSLGAILLSLWLTAAASSAKWFAFAQSAAASIPGMIVLFLFTLALFYHFCNGIRHLGWDAGYGFDLPVARRNGALVIAGSVALTAITWIIGLIIW